LTQVCTLPKNSNSESNSSNPSYSNLPEFEKRFTKDFQRVYLTRSHSHFLLKRFCTKTSIDFALFSNVDSATVGYRVYVSAKGVSRRLDPDFRLDDFVEVIQQPSLKSPQENLELLSQKTANILKDIKECNFRSVLTGLSTLNLSIRNIVLSKELPEDVAEELGSLSTSIDTCTRFIFEGIQNGDSASTMEEKGIKDFLIGVKHLLKQFSSMK
jgi:hypothetical protein